MGRVPADVAEWAAAIRAGHRTAVSRAVTLVESSRPADRETARRLVVLLDPYAGSAHRIGMTGPPGVGKSTLIDALGLRLTSGSRRVAVLAMAGAGDDLQAIKMGVLERADIVAVTKADGAGADAARATAREISAARRLAGSVHGRRPPPVVPCSARLGTGLAELWKRIEEHHAGADLPARRGAQRAAQLRAVARDSL